MARNVENLDLQQALIELTSDQNFGNSLLLNDGKADNIDALTLECPREDADNNMIVPLCDSLHNQIFASANDCMNKNNELLSFQSKQNKVNAMDANSNNLSQQMSFSSPAPADLYLECLNREKSASKDVVITPEDANDSVSIKNIAYPICKSVNSPKKIPPEERNTEETSNFTCDSTIEQSEALNCNEGDKNLRKQESAANDRLGSSCNENQFNCTECGLSFCKKRSLAYHMSKHSGVRSHQCEECGKAFVNMSALKNHQRTHTGFRPHKCEKCGMAFVTKGNLKNHLRTHSSEKPYKCLQCGMAFGHKGNLKNHLFTHTGLKPFKCTICGIAFAQKGNIKNHMKIHTGERPYTCELCGKSFHQAFALKVHMRVHTGDRPFACEKCGRAFALKRNLKSHMLTHTGEKPYKCDKCGKSYAHKSDVKVHQRVHNDEKPYVCSECGKSFRYNGNFRRHARLHSNCIRVQVAFKVQC